MKNNSDSYKATKRVLPSGKPTRTYIALPKKKGIWARLKDAWQGRVEHTPYPTYNFYPPELPERKNDD